MEALLDFTRPVDVPLLDRVVAVFFDASNPQVRLFELIDSRHARGHELACSVGRMLSCAAHGCGRGDAGPRDRANRVLTPAPARPPLCSAARRTRC
jgi:hypothetical protein